MSNRSVSIKVVLAALISSGAACDNAPSPPPVHFAPPPGHLVDDEPPPPPVSKPAPSPAPPAAGATPATATLATATPAPTGPGALHAGELDVGSDEGRNNFTAVFDAPLGERITAESSSVECKVRYDDKANSFSGSCGVALPTIMVDNDSTKTDHFQQWATNKKTEPAKCRFEAQFDAVKVESSIRPGMPAKFTADAPFSICGRARTDGGREHVTGTVVLLPDGKALRVRAQIDGFSRDKYHIGPAYTEGWLARVQKLAPVVSDEGSITLSLFAGTK